LSVSVAQCFVAGVESQSQFVFQLAKVITFPPHAGQFFLQTALHRATRLRAIPSQPQQPANFAQLESQALYAANKG
jgi:hypothetical protein